MGAKDGSGAPRRRSWRQRLGLAPEAPGPEDWVRAAEIRVDESGKPRHLDRAVSRLREAGMETQQRPYVIPDENSRYGFPIPDASERVRIAILVRARDLDRARELLKELRLS